MPLLITRMLSISAGTLLNGLRLKKVHINRLIMEAAMAAVCLISMNG